MSAEKQAAPRITLAEVFAAHWPAYAAQHDDAIPPAHRRAAKAILACRTETRGIVRSVCEACREVTVAPISCGHRSCAQCGTAQAVAWRERSAAKLLPVPHFLLTFTVPEQLRALIRSHPEECYAAMFAAHTSALADVLRDKLGGGGAWTSVLHTWTRQLIFHPHIHSVAAGCVITAEGVPRIVKKRDYLVPHALLGARWRDALHAQLRALRESSAAFCEAYDAIPEATWTRKWVIDIQAVGSGEKAMNYLARYVQKTALDSARIVAFDEASVTISWHDRETKARRQAKLSGHEFLRRFLQHVVPTGFMRIRHCGYYAPNAHKRYGALCALLAHRPSPPKPWTPSCAKCGGETIIVSIRVGRKLIIPQAARDHFGADAILEEEHKRPP